MKYVKKKVGLSSFQKVDKEVFRKIFIENWEEFKRRYPSYAVDQYEEVINKMFGCGKEYMGYSEYVCSKCNKGIRRIGFSCKSYFCLSCAKVYVDNFVCQISKVLHPGVRYRHVVLTIPEQFRIHFYRDRKTKTLLSEFMRCGYECLEDLASEIKGKPIKIGAIIVVQTHGRSGKYNPHLHIMMPTGGIDERKGKWEELYIPYELIHHKWQYHLFGLMKRVIHTKRMKKLVDSLWKKYPNGIVANVKKGDVPERCRGLAIYLAKYLSCPPISIRRILNYDGKKVTYWYKDHETKKKKVETIDVYTFIGRMVQHVFPKGFQRVRYYGLQSTKSFKKWSKTIKEGLKKAGRIVKGVYQVLFPKKYRERYIMSTGRDPLKCSYCGSKMELFVRVWDPGYI